MSELKECPFCGQQPKETKYREFGKNPREYSLYHCLNEGCPSYFTKPGSMTAEDWNTRPIEDALRARISELEEEIRWLPVGERLPEKNFDEDWKSYDTVVQYVEQKPFLTICNYQDGKWFDIDEDYRDITRWVTHWRERPDLPEPPEDK